MDDQSNVVVAVDASDDPVAYGIRPLRNRSSCLYSSGVSHPTVSSTLIVMSLDRPIEDVAHELRPDRMVSSVENSMPSVYGRAYRTSSTAGVAT